MTEIAIPKDVQDLLKQSKLDQIRKTLAEEKAANERDVTPLLILKIPYYGARTGWRVYHPLKCYNPEKAFQFAKRNFMAELKAWYDVVQLYHDDMVLSEKVITEGVKKEVDKVLVEIDRAPDPYLLEALAEVLWDKDGAVQLEDGVFDGPSEKTDRHELTMMVELRRRAEELKHLDLGVRLDKPTPSEQLVKHTWSG